MGDLAKMSDSITEILDSLSARSRRDDDTCPACESNNTRYEGAQDGYHQWYCHECGSYYEIPEGGLEDGLQ